MQQTRVMVLGFSSTMLPQSRMQQDMHACGWLGLLDGCLGAGVNGRDGHRQGRFVVKVVRLAHAET